MIKRTLATVVVLLSLASCSRAGFYVIGENYAEPRDPNMAQIHFGRDIFPLRANGKRICWEGLRYCKAYVPGHSPGLEGTLYLPPVPTKLYYSLEHTSFYGIRFQSYFCEVAFSPERGKQYQIVNSRVGPHSLAECEIKELPSG